ncbi:hypothetical protein V8G54_002153 [Vigna mungo]|uniref:Uncharacterized protein n=1 Tax=Vigna mungo TaxID=3915 RepID=A0AAQ3P940_VIGMU
MDHSSAYGKFPFPYNAPPQRFNMFFESVLGEFLQPSIKFSNNKNHLVFNHMVSSNPGLSSSSSHIHIDTSMLNQSWMNFNQCNHGTIHSVNNGSKGFQPLNFKD